MLLPRSRYHGNHSYRPWSL